MQEYPWWHEADSALSKIASRVQCHDFNTIETLHNASYIKTNLTWGILGILREKPERVQELVRWFARASTVVDEIVGIHEAVGQLHRATWGADNASQVFGLQDEYARWTQKVIRNCLELRELIQEEVGLPKCTPPPPRESRKRRTAREMRTMK